MDLAFYGRVSTEDAQDPEVSRAWQIRRARDLVEPAGHTITAEFFDIGQSRSLPWKRRPEAARLLNAVRDPKRGFDGIVVGEPQRAFYGHQFAMTFPVLVHYGVTLWVPEVGGQVDPDSDTHDLMMSLFGGMSKGERSRIRIRTRTAMQELAATTDRFLGGRPPYGYRLADAGPHPNPSKAAAGQRGHRLEPDPVTAPHVAWMFQLYADGGGFRSIAEALTQAGVPSPSAYDPDRNKHRDPRGWSHGSVRAILLNPVYSGVRMWGKQEKVESLLDVEDVAAGTQTRMRWRERDQWVDPDRQTHEPLIPADVMELVTARAGKGTSSGVRKPRDTHRVYPLRGLVFCGVCGRRMQGEYRPSKREGGQGRRLYRCDQFRARAVAPEIVGHPKTVVLNEGLLLPLLDAWIEDEFTDPTWLAAQQVSAEIPPAVVALRHRKAQLDEAVANLTGAIERGLISQAVLDQLHTREIELAQVKAELAVAARPVVAVSPEQVQGWIEALGGLAAALGKATDAERQDIYEALGLRLDYDPAQRTVRATATPHEPEIAGRCSVRVRRGT